MKSTKVKLILFKSKTLKDGTHPVLLRLTKDRKSKYVSTGFNCLPKDWNENKQELKTTFSNYREANLFLKQLFVKTENVILDCESQQQDYSIETVLKKLSRNKKTESIIKYLEKEVENLDRSGKAGNSRVYKDLKRSLIKFAGDKIEFSDVNYAFLKKYEIDFLGRGVKGSSISIYLRTLRAVFNKAINEGVIEKGLYPFNGFKVSGIKSEVEKRRALTTDELVEFTKVETVPFSMEDNAKNYFLFSVYAIGINFLDLAQLTKKNIQNDRLIYTRSKTGKVFSIKLHSHAMDIIHKYQSETLDSPFLFPILKSHHNTPAAKKERITSLNIKINKFIKKVAIKAKIENTFGLTYYSARHTWATLQKKRGQQVAVISESLGHSTEKVTHAYLESFENNVIDKANSDFINSL